MQSKKAAILGLVTIGLGTGCCRLLAQPSADDAPISPRNASYDIDVRLDPANRELRGRQVVTWRNIQPSATDELWFHLYWNAWRNNRSTWMLEDRLRERSDLGDEIAAEDWGWIEVDALRLLDSGDGGAVDLHKSARFVAPDDGNGDDRTVLLVDLPGPVDPGATARIELAWRARVPRTFARTGFRGDYFFFAHWFPKLGVFTADGWSCRQYHASTEYFSDYGVYEVRVTLPQRFVVGSTGRQVDRSENPDGTVTYRHVQEDVHAFSWTASPDYLVLEDRFEEPGLPAVDLRLLLQPEHRSQARRHFHATQAALRTYGRWYGPYPYGHLTVVDPAWGSGAGGMEYPTLFTAGTRLFNPFGGGSPEGVTVHEAGHQFWYGLIGNDEFEHAWLDEGLNTFSTSRTLHETYGPPLYSRRFFTPPGTDLQGFFPVLLPGFGYARSPYDSRVERYRRLADIDRQDTPSYRYFPAAAGALSYSKTALWLGTLERYLGWDRLQPAMSRFFREWRFGHPRPEDFFAALEAETGEELGWFVDQVFRSSARFDYSVESVSSTPAGLEGFVEDSGELVFRAAAPDTGGRAADSLFAGPESTTLYRSEVVVRRRGGGVFPVDILLVFEDGEEVRYPWRGEQRWRLIVAERPARLAWAAIDPDGVLLLDLDRTNNTRQREAAAWEPALQWAARWLIWLEDFLAMASFFA